MQDLNPNTHQLETLVQQVIAAINQHHQQLNQQTPPKELMNLAGVVEIEYADDNNYEPMLYFEKGTYFVSFRKDFFEVTKSNQAYGFEDNSQVWRDLKRKHNGQVQILVGLPDTWQ